MVAVLRANKIIYMDSVETTKTVRAISRTGAMLPAQCTAVGKAQLAFLPTSEIERLLPDANLSTLTPRSIKSRDLLLSELKAIADKGYAIENEECDLEVKSVAAPIRDFSKNVVAAVGIVAPASRLTDEKIEKGGIAQLIMEAGAAISAKLGFIASYTKHK